MKMDTRFITALPRRRTLLPIFSRTSPLGSIKTVETRPPMLITAAFSLADAPKSDKNNGNNGVTS
jgi:hypothetical protein